MGDADGDGEGVDDGGGDTLPSPSCVRFRWISPSLPNA